MVFPLVLPPLQCCFSLPTVSHILDSMACEGCRHLRDVEDDPGTEQVAKGHSVGVPRAAIPKADSAHGAGRSEEDLYSGLSALEPTTEPTSQKHTLSSHLHQLRQKHKLSKLSHPRSATSPKHKSRDGQCSRKRRRARRLASSGTTPRCVSAPVTRRVTRKTVLVHSG